VQELEYRIDVCLVTRGANIDTSLFVSKQVSMELSIDIKSDRAMALGSTQPQTRNEYQEYFLGIKAAGA